MSIEKEYYQKLNQMFEMSSYAPDETGLPMKIWIHTLSDAVDADNPNQKFQHNQPYIKFELDHVLYSISIEDDPKFLNKVSVPLRGKALRQLKSWIIQNKEDLLEHWNGKISSTALGLRLQRKLK
uniref:Uncharacterized protein n=1 Tax=Siphoviridae sp. ctYh54 TaxID=2826379 RepID=A0A8S5MEL2_9CAUD|nr:MAG TPA: protein of unknown function (DUF4160) [Siphoviridae sp. ctYh54]